MGGRVDASKATSQAQNTANSQGFNQSLQGSQSQGTQGSMSQGTQGSQNVSSQGSMQDAFNQSTQSGVSGSSSSGSQQSSQNVFGAQVPGLKELYAAAQGLIGGQSAQAQGAQGIADAGRSAWLGALTPGGNPAFSKSLQGAIDAANQSFTRGVLPELEARGVGVDQYGGKRDQLARGEAAGLQQQGVQRMIGDLTAQQYATDQQRQLQALGLTGAQQGAQFANLDQARALLGGPTVLGQSSGQQSGSSFGTTTGQSTGGSTGSSFGQSSGSSFGQNTGSSFGQNTGSSFGESLGLTSSNAQGTQGSSSKSMGVGVGAK